jgi:hypothetical protein
VRDPGRGPQRRPDSQMRSRFANSIFVVAVVSLVSTSIGAQSPAAARQPYNPPRILNGIPDLQGVWQAVNTAAWDVQDHNASVEVPGGEGVVEGNEIPYQPWAVAKKRENFENRASADPETKCYLPGVPRITYMPFPFHIAQTAGQVAIAYEYLHAFRVIHTNGTPHLAEIGELDSWMGDSRGHWEGNTLVVDVTLFNDQTWFDRAGNFHSDALHIVERYTLTGPDHMLYEVTIEDPKVFTRPWKMSMPLYRRKEARARLFEYECYAYLFEKADRQAK